MKQSEIDRLNEIKDQMQSLMDEVDSIMRFNSPRHVYERAKAYWLGHIFSALDDANSFLPLPETMEQTIGNLEAEEDEDDEDEDEDE